MTQKQANITASWSLAAITYYININHAIIDEYQHMHFFTFNTVLV